MANGFTIVTNRDNTFFTNNKMTVGSGIPTSGSYKIGDIVISNSQANGVFGWVCTQAGSPGRWEVIGSGSSGGGNSVLVEYSNVVEFTDARTSIDIGIPEYNKAKDSLEVHYNGLLLAQDVHYSINEAGTAITNLNGSWNENADDTQAMIFVVRKSTAGLNVIPMRNIVDINIATMEVDPGIKINLSSDIVSVHLNGVLLMEGIDYNIENGMIVKVEQDEAWNPYNVVGQKMFIDVLRNKGSLNEPDMGSISKEHLTSELAGEIDNNTNSINSLTEIANSHTTLINNLTTQIENVDFSEVEAKINVNTASIGDKTQLQTTAKDNLVAAINELFQSANNGKELIANAIGEPLVSTDTFSAMSNRINGLTSNFKTALMNNGVSVTSTDKFKQLIEKIALLADSEGKTLRMAEGNLSIPNMGSISEYNKSYSQTVNLDLDFQPNIIFIKDFNYTCHYDYYNGGREHARVWISNVTQYNSVIGWDDYINTSLNGKSLTVTIGCSNSSYGVIADNNTSLQYWAFGVGEETTSSGLNIISATELPAKGVDNQICVITDNPVDLFTVSSNFNDKNNTDTSYITLYLGNTATNDASEGTLLSVSGGNVITNYYFVKACQGENRLDSYYWLNNKWNRLTQSGIYFVENGVERNHNYFGGIPAGSGAGFTTNGLTLLYSYNSPYKNVTTENTINFSLYNKLDITFRNPDTSISYFVYVGYASTDHFTSQGWYPTNSTGGNEPSYSNVTDAYKEIQVTRGQTVSQTIDISSWTGEGWLFLAAYNGNMDLYITDLKLY